MANEIRIAEIKKRIASIDEMFDSATSWGSWMSELSGDRRALVREAAKHGVVIQDKWLRKIDDVDCPD